MESTRLRLRRFNSSDYNNMRELESDPEVMKFTSMRVPFNKEQTQTRLQSLLEKEKEREPFGVWAVETKGDADFVGWFMLLKTKNELPELGFMIVQRQWGRGYTTEACKVLLDHAFNDLGVVKVTATTDPANESSKNVLLKLGFLWVRNENQLEIFEIDKP